ncbi:MAG TPA: V-type ATPase subunit [Gemmatimonadales bacterium]|nr:V-type ATPase subunit [Gemmatimonadales bacterium]
MKPTWDDLGARARGLGTHLCSRGELDALAQCPDAAALGEALRDRGYPLAEGDASPAALELAVRHAAAERLRILARWCGPRAAVLGVLFEDEDRRSLRSLLRGAVEGAPAGARLAGLVPTPSLPERALGELAAQRSLGAIAALLTAWGNPYGSALFAAASAAQPDLFRLELALNLNFARRASRAARRVRVLAAWVREVLDLENVCTAFVLVKGGTDLVPKDTFVPGGARISIREFEVAAATGDVRAAANGLAAAFAGTPFADALRSADDPSTLEDALLRAQIEGLRRAARLRPLGPVPVLLYWLRLRAEGVDLRRIIWGVALAVPPASITRDFATT